MSIDYGDYDLRQIIEPELYRDENLMWVGRPKPLRLATKNLTRSLFGLVWTGVAVFIFFQLRAFRSGFPAFGRSAFDNVPFFFQLFLGLFVLIGLGMILSPVWRYIKATRTVYALTDRRAFIVERLLGQSVTSYTADDFTQLQRHGDDLSGDIIFRREVERYRDSKGRSRTRTVDIGFFGIPNPREVERLMLDIARAEGKG